MLFMLKSLFSGGSIDEQVRYPHGGLRGIHFASTCVEFYLFYLKKL